MADRSDAGSFLVEDFIGSITTQLDRVQDGLRIKAVNRPLTYALKELHLELKVFIDMDASGQVRLRAGGPNEAGASTLAMDFTTITKPMIEENTITLAASRSTPLDRLGLTGEERSRLERLGVSNLAQLDRLKASTGVNTVARMADVPVDRLRRALQAGQPAVGGIRLGPVQAGPRLPSTPPAPAQPPSFTPSFTPSPEPAASPWPPRSEVQPPLVQPPVVQPPLRGMPLRPGANLLRVAPITPNIAQALAQAPAADVIHVPAHSRRLQIDGQHLLHADYPPEVRLNGEALAIEELDDDRLVVQLPAAFGQGALEVSLGGQAPVCFALVSSLADEVADPWAPPGRHAP